MILIIDLVFDMSSTNTLQYMKQKYLGLLNGKNIGKNAAKLTISYLMNVLSQYLIKVKIHNEIFKENYKYYLHFHI